VGGSKKSKLNCGLLCAILNIQKYYIFSSSKIIFYAGFIFYGYQEGENPPPEFSFVSKAQKTIQLCEVGQGGNMGFGGGDPLGLVEAE
jgi:hypothetical protein